MSAAHQNITGNYGLHSSSPISSRLLLTFTFTGPQTLLSDSPQFTLNIANPDTCTAGKTLLLPGSPCLPAADQMDQPHTQTSLTCVTSLSPHHNFVRLTLIIQHRVFELSAPSIGVTFLQLTQTSQHHSRRLSRLCLHLFNTYVDPFVSPQMMGKTSLITHMTR